MRIPSARFFHRYRLQATVFISFLLATIFLLVIGWLSLQKDIREGNDDLVELHEYVLNTLSKRFQREDTYPVLQYINKPAGSVVSPAAYTSSPIPTEARFSHDYLHMENIKNAYIVSNKKTFDNDLSIFFGTLSRLKKGGGDVFYPAGQYLHFLIQINDESLNLRNRVKNYNPTQTDHLKLVFHIPNNNSSNDGRNLRFVYILLDTDFEKSELNKDDKYFNPIGAVNGYLTDASWNIYGPSVKQISTLQGKIFPTDSPNQYAITFRLPIRDISSDYEVDLTRSIGISWVDYDGNDKKREITSFIVNDDEIFVPMGFQLKDTITRTIDALLRAPSDLGSTIIISERLSSGEYKDYFEWCFETEQSKSCDLPLLSKLDRFLIRVLALHNQIPELPTEPAFIANPFNRDTDEDRYAISIKTPADVYYENVLNRSRAILNTTIGSILVLAAICLFLLLRLRRIHDLASNAQRCLSDDLPIAIDQKYQSSNDEIGWLARSFQRLLRKMSREMVENEKLIIKIQNERKSLQEEMEEKKSLLDVNQRLLTTIENDQAALKRRMEFKERLGNIVGHEIRAPLQTLRIRLENDPESCRRLDRIEHATTAILDADDLEALFQDATLRHIKINEGLHYICKNHPDATFSDLNRTLWVYADGELLEIAIEHVLSNAQEFKVDGTLIEVSLREGNERNNAIIRIFNQGPNIDDTDAIFFLGHSTRKDNQKVHLGQGLYMARGYITTMGGDISVINMPDGVAFEIRVPLVEAPETRS